MKEFSYNGFEVRPGKGGMEVSLIAERKLEPTHRCKCTSGRIFEGVNRSAVLRAIHSEEEEPFEWTFKPRSVAIEVGTYFVTSFTWSILTDKIKEIVDSYSTVNEKFNAERRELAMKQPAGSVDPFSINIYYGEIDEERSMQDAY